MAQGTRTRLTDDQRALVLELARSGMARNGIARQVACSTSTVSVICHAAGVSFERTQTMAATKARQADNAARRAGIISKLYDITDRRLEEMDQPHLVFAFGGKDNDYKEHRLKKPPSVDMKNLMQAANMAMQKAVELERVDTAQGADQIRTMLGDLWKSIQSA